MSITQNGAAAGEFITAALAKQHVPIDHDDDDTVIGVYIAAAQDWIERVCDVRFGVASFTYTGSNFDLSFVGYPEPSVTGITYVDLDGATQTITEYTIEDYCLMIEGAPSAQSVTVDFDAGYADAANNPRTKHYVLAGLMLIAAFYEERANVSDAQTQPLPFGVKSLIAAARTFAR